MKDSFNSIQALASMNIRNQTMQDCFMLLKGLPCVSIMHVPSHMGIIGNEIADKICTVGLKAISLRYKSLRSPSPCQTIAYENYWRKIVCECTPASQSNLFLNEFAYDEESIANLSRIHTNAGKFNAYLNDINKSYTRKCPNCDAEDTIDHFLYECAHYMTQRNYTQIMLDVGIPGKGPSIK